MEIKNSKGIKPSVDLTENSDFRAGYFTEALSFNHGKKDVPWDSKGKMKRVNNPTIKFLNSRNFTSTVYDTYMSNYHYFNNASSIPEEILEDIDLNLAFIATSVAYVVSRFYIEDNSKVCVYYNLDEYCNNINTEGFSINYRDVTTYIDTTSTSLSYNITPKEFNGIHLTANEFDGSKLITSKNHDELTLKIKLKKYLEKVMDIITPRPDRVCKSFKNTKRNVSRDHVRRNQLPKSIDYTMGYKEIDILYDQPYYLSNKPKTIDYFFLNKYDGSNGVNLLRSKYLSVRPEELNNMEVGLNGEEVKPIKRGTDIFINI